MLPRGGSGTFRVHLPDSPLTHSTAAIVLAVLLVGCDASSSPSTPTHLTLDASAPVDLHFDPLDWTPGERLAVVVGEATLESVAGRGGHDIALRAPGRDVLRVEGILDGRVTVASPAFDGPVVPGGQSADGPTSVHRMTVCRGGTCAEVIEYDYDRTAPGGDGTTEWEAPSGERGLVDRVRFVLADAGPSARLRVTSPRPLDVVR